MYVKDVLYTWLKTILRRSLGRGALNSPLVLIGEGPGLEEDKMGHPFVGKAGQLLTTILNKLEIQRERVYITNIIKCRPPNNRTPQERNTGMLTKPSIRTFNHSTESYHCFRCSSLKLFQT